MADIKWLEGNRIQIAPPKRTKKITGTRFATILGLNPWSTAFEMWCAITKTYEKPFEDTIYTVAGKTIEPKQARYINSTKAPAIYSMKRAVDVMTGKTVVDIGGGRFDTAAEAARVYGAAVSIYDPFNRTPEHNAAVLAGSYDVAVISNVLNVIDSDAARGEVVQLAAQKAAALLITVYEGDGSGTGRQTAADSWQENRGTADYMGEIAAALPGWNVARFGRLIQATQKR